MNPIPRLRMFAGPNGSGKSTIKSVMNPALLGIYINPDEIEKELHQQGGLNVAAYQVQTTENEILDYFSSSTLLEKAGMKSEAQLLNFHGNTLDFSKVTVNAYFASVAADFLRQKLIDTQLPFTFETVMSSPDKIDLLRRARKNGYRTYLYFVATEDPEINCVRVRHRVKQGGHDVPKEKIISRYYRSLGLLMEAIQSTNRAYIFDNSGHRNCWISEITDGRVFELKVEQVPAWFKQYVLDKLS